MSYDGSSVTVALMSDLHGVAVAKVPTNATSTTKVQPVLLKVARQLPQPSQPSIPPIKCT